MIEATRKHISKFPVDRKGKHILPCVALLPENMEEWMKGMRVTVGLFDPATSTTQGVIVSWTDDKLCIELGGKKKQFDYNPLDIQLCVFQFDMGVVFNGMDREPNTGVGLSSIQDSKTLLQSENNTCAVEKEEVELPKKNRAEKVLGSSFPKTTNVSSYRPRIAIERC